MLCAYLNFKLWLNHHLLTGIMYIDLSTTLIYYAECLSEFQTRIRSSSSHWNHVHWLLNYPCLPCCVLIWITNSDWIIIFSLESCTLTYQLPLSTMLNAYPNSKLGLDHHLLTGIMYNDFSTTLVCYALLTVWISNLKWIITLSLESCTLTSQLPMSTMLCAYLNFKLRLSCCLIHHLMYGTFLWASFSPYVFSVSL